MTAPVATADTRRNNQATWPEYESEAPVRTDAARQEAGRSMIADDFGLVTSTRSAIASAAFERAQRALAAHRPQTGAEIAATLAADPHHAAALALKGFGQVLLARCELAAEAKATVSSARAALDRSGNGGTPDERALVESATLAADGNLSTAADALDRAFRDRPATLLPFKLAHQLRFMAGDRAGMLRASTAMLRDWDETAPGAGFLIGCHAFALEEHGRYEEAEAAGRFAVEIEPEDAWGLHAVSHVYEMRGEPESGIDWLEGTRPAWSGCNNFAFHVAWHLALHYLERGDHARVLDLYDRDVRPSQTDDFRDVSNAVSLLWRLDLHGIDVGDRWSALTTVLEHRQNDATLVFASLHTLAGLLAVGRRGAADAVLSALQARAQGVDEQALVARRVGLPVARFMLRRSRSHAEGFASLVKQLLAIGGSNAQRDFLVLWLMHEAARSGDRACAGAILEVRRTLRPDDRLSDAARHSPRVPSLVPSVAALS